MQGGDQDTLYSEKFQFGNNQSAVNCTGPDAGATVHVSGNLTAPRVELPAEGFQCSCVCDDQFPSALGSVAVLLRATDIATDARPNWKNLTSECSSPPLWQEEQVFVTTCSSSQRPGVQVCDVVPSVLLSQLSSPLQVSSPH
jgi:hypothetical protein